MPRLEVHGNFSAEKAKSNDRFDSVSSAIGVIESQIEILNTNWKDEKSEAFITDLTTYATDLKTQLATARTRAEEAFGEIIVGLQIW